MTMKTYSVVIYRLEEPDTRLVIARVGTKEDARRIMRGFAGKDWTIERRPDLHSYGDLVLTFFVAE